MIYTPDFVCDPIEDKSELYLYLQYVLYSIVN